MKGIGTVFQTFVLMAILALLGVIVWQQAPRGTPLDDEPYVAVLLTGGSAYYGKVEQASADFLILGETHYIRRGQNKETGETANVLVKRGQEVHGPTGMVIPVTSIQFLEPVAADSEIGRQLHGG
jgi:hypothetical protein